MTIDINIWRIFLAGVAALNIVCWCWSSAALRQRAAVLAPHTARLRFYQLMLSGIYVFGCAFRSIFPVYDVPRLCFSNSWLSSVLVGRSVATLAELCFVAQCALLMNEAARAARSDLGRVAALAVVPLVAVAETCSWYSVLTTSNLGHVIEESLWGVAVTLLVAAMFDLYPRCTPRGRSLLVALCAAGVAYVVFMFTMDVPMYWSRWLVDQAAGREYMTLAQGFHDVATRQIVSFRWRDWRSEILWMSLYFSVAVWISISFIHAPPPAGRIIGAATKRLPGGVPAQA